MTASHTVVYQLVQFSTPTNKGALKKALAYLKTSFTRSKIVYGELADPEKYWDLLQLLKKLKCTNILFGQKKMYFKDEGGFWLTTLDKQTNLPPEGIEGEIGVPYDSVYQKSFYSKSECRVFAFKNNYEAVIES